MTDFDTGERRGPTRAKKIRTAIAVTLAIACAAGSAWIRWGMKKEGLGGPCSYKMHCGDEAPTCLRQNEIDQGTCSRECDPASDCAPGIACVSVDLDERDETGHFKKGGYCVPEDRLPKRKKRLVDAGAPRDAGLRGPPR